jgi:SAM-dependent methyltransferase
VPDDLKSEYDAIAGMYDFFWSNWYLPAALPALENLFFSVVQTSAPVLDVCCGSGHVTEAFVRRGYQVTGVDSSPCLIRKARCRLPSARFHVQDIRSLALSDRFDAAYSTFDSLNHLLSLEGLKQALSSVHSVLHSGAPFVFDMNLEQAYLADARQWTAMVTDNHVGLVRGVYSFDNGLAETELIWFERDVKTSLWEQRRGLVRERCYSQDEIIGAVSDAGFRQVESFWASDIGVTAELGFGRMFFRATA